VFEDGGVSGVEVDFEDRPAFAQLLSSEPEVVVVQDSDRLGRNEYFWHKLRHFHPDLRILSLDHKVDTSDPAKEMTSSIHGSISADEARRIKERTMRGRVARAKEGKWVGGPPPFGFRIEQQMLVHDKAEVATLRRAARLVTPARTLSEVVEKLNAEGHLPRQHNPRWR
jgi:DNA invertase Pin-like site-specific DNA recombinase